MKVATLKEVPSFCALLAKAPGKALGTCTARKQLLAVHKN